MTIKKPDKYSWDTRWTQYMSYGNPKLQYEQLITAAIVFGGVSFIFTVVIYSALNRDDRALHQLRATYRQRWRARRRRIRSVDNRSGAPGFQAVNQREGIDPGAPLIREVAWKKLQGEVFRRPSCHFILSLLTGAGA